VFGVSHRLFVRADTCKVAPLVPHRCSLHLHAPVVWWSHLHTLYLRVRSRTKPAPPSRRRNQLDQLIRSLCCCPRQPCRTSRATFFHGVHRSQWFPPYALSTHTLLPLSVPRRHRRLLLPIRKASNQTRPPRTHPLRWP
jgi:hypothetical protein